jgi:hypothetical protein
MYSMWEMRNGLPHSVIRIKVYDGKLRQCPRDIQGDGRPR